MAATVTSTAGVALRCKCIRAASQLIMSVLGNDGYDAAAACTASMASRMASLVAGARSGGLTRCPATAETASRSAKNTENGNSRGGSPTALERWMLSATLLFLNRLTRKSAGQSDTAGIL